MIYNIMLDKLPTEYKGYALNTDFRVVFEIYRCFSNKDLSDIERKQKALCLLYVDIPDDLNLAWDGLEWFLGCGDTCNINTEYANKGGSSSDNPEEEEDIYGLFEDEMREKEKDKGDDTIIDFDFDSTRLYSAFLRTYKIDLTEIEYLHYFKFSYLLADIDSDSALAKVMEYRNTPLTGKKGEERRALRKVKKLYEIPYEIDEQSKKDLEELGFDDSDFDLYMQ